MDKLKQSMISQAEKMYKKIYPCGHKTDLSECFTTSDEQIFFWFNTEDRTTRLIRTEKGKAKAR
ncbi:hypothetical protein QA601_13665 [Chitinispirillales bacterium ANBcel5]|uniref:hypothetical protein n=1 Tax=Cellulosispirillum alkaliphilum TaxID=3039283 RepID=UPI002A58A083|nr:hypothetical protein [Chitinispirillales bacterium ANBcel5]